MIIVEKNEGAKIAYEQIGTKIIFDDDLMLNLAKRQLDEPVHIDICYNKARALTIGTDDAWAYVAEIDIPPMEYEEVESEEISTSEMGMGNEAERTPLPLDMDKVVMTLWALK